MRPELEVAALQSGKTVQVKCDLADPAQSGVDGHNSQICRFPEKTGNLSLPVATGRLCGADRPMRVCACSNTRAVKDG